MNDEGPCYRCKHCGGEFPPHMKTEFQEHVNTHVADAYRFQREGHICGKCQYWFRYHADLAKHVCGEEPYSHKHEEPTLEGLCLD